MCYGPAMYSPAQGQRRYCAFLALAFATGLLFWGSATIHPSPSSEFGRWYWLFCAAYAVAAVGWAFVEVIVTLKSIRHQRAAAKQRLDANGIKKSLDRF